MGEQTVFQFSIDGRTIGNGAVGELTKELADRYRAHASTHGTPVV